MEQALNKEVWLLSEGPNQLLYPWMYPRFRQNKFDMVGKDIALVLDSFGGDAVTAYRIASLFQKTAGSGG